MERERLTLSRREALVAGAGLVGAAAGISAIPLPVLADNAEPKDDQTDGSLPVQQIEQIMETTGKVSNGVLFIELDRNDLTVTGPNGIPFKPAFELTHEFFFQPIGNNRAFLNAELTFVEREREKVLDAIFRNGLVVMAQHQHFIGENPQTWHYHFRGIGDPIRLAQAAINVVKATSTPLPQPQPSNPTTPLPAATLAAILKGTADIGSDGVVTVSVPRRDRIVVAGVTLKPEAGVEHTIAFEPLDSSGHTAAVAPDYALVASEVNRALMTSRALGFQVHCLYNQETAEYPQLYFSHNLAVGDPVNLARKIRTVLDKTNTVGSPMTGDGGGDSGGGDNSQIGSNGG